MNRPLYYILDGTEIRPANMLEAMYQFNPSNRGRIIGNDLIEGFHVSTVFLVIDHCFSNAGKPILFETMIFGTKGRPIDFYQQRCSTYNQAVKMHQKAIIYLKARILIPASEGQALSKTFISPSGTIVKDKNYSLIKRLKNYGLRNPHRRYYLR